MEKEKKVKKIRNARPGPAKGVVNNPNGRPKGSKNIVTAELREKMNNFLSGEFPRFIENMEKVEDPIMRSKLFLEAYKATVSRPVDDDEKEKQDEYREQLLIALKLK